MDHRFLDTVLLRQADPPVCALSLSKGASTSSALVRRGPSSQPQPTQAAIAARRATRSGGRYLPGLEQFGYQRRRTCGPVPFYRPIVDLPPDLLRDHRRDRFGRR